MSDRSGIEWTEATWNPTTGCDRTSPGCDHCYALTLARRLKAMGNAKYSRDGDPRTSGPGFGLTTHPDQLELPRRWKTPRTIFVNSMSDLFHPDVPDSFIADVFSVISETPQHTYQLLTKRSQRMRRLLDDWRLPTNLWLGVSIESNRYAFRADHLRETPAKVKFVSAEPLLGPLNELDLDGIDWVIAGGESGRGARPMHPSWAASLRDRCNEKGVSFFFKQWGAWAPVDEGTRLAVAVPESSHTDDLRSQVVHMRQVGKGVAGRRLDGRTWDDMPARVSS
jgi:protein gp37